MHFENCESQGIGSSNANIFPILILAKMKVIIKLLVKLVKDGKLCLEVTIVKWSNNHIIDIFCSTD